MNDPMQAHPRRDFLAVSLSSLTLFQSIETFANSNGTQESDPLDTNPGYVAPLYYGNEEEDELLDVLQSGSPFRFWGAGKPDKVLKFEERFANYMGTQFALGVTSGTAALDCAVAALGIGPGDEVIVPAYTWWSDYTCVVHASALPVFVDIDRTFNLDPNDFKQKITSRTKAVIAVHLLGGPCEMDPIVEIARQNNISVIEDCAQCVGGSYKGKRLGSIGDIGIYSFQINKMISSGEGGAVVTNDPFLYERAVRFHDMGGIRKLFVDRINRVQDQQFAGENFRMSEFTGAVLKAQIEKLDTMISDMRRNANAIRDGVSDLKNIRMRKRPDPDGDIGYAVYFEVKNKQTRDRCIKELRDRRIPASTLSGSVLLPIQESVIQKRTRHPNWPSFNSYRGKSIQYGPDSCKPTLDIFDRFVQIRIGPKFTNEVNQYIVESVREAYNSSVL